MMLMLVEPAAPPPPTRVGAVAASTRVKTCPSGLPSAVETTTSVPPPLLRTNPPVMLIVAEGRLALLLVFIVSVFGPRSSTRFRNDSDDAPFDWPQYVNLPWARVTSTS